MSEMPELEGGDSFVPLESGETGEAPAPAQVQLDEAILAAAPVSDKKKKRVSVNWNRPKSHLYEYNYGKSITLSTTFIKSADFSCFI